MQDEIREKSVAFVINLSKDSMKLTAEIFKWAICQYLKHAKEPKHGKQSVKNLIKQGSGVQNIEITNNNIKSFERIARKYGVDFALKKIPAQGKYFIFFKARDADILNAAFTEYTAKTLNKGNGKLSIKQQLANYKQLAKELNVNREKNRQKGGIEL